MKWKFWAKTKKVEEQPKKVVPIVIPEPIREIEEYKGKIDHNEFNVLLDVDRTMYRIRNEQSHEVVRMVCKCYHNKMKRIISDAHELHYVEKVEERSFVRRLFITDSGNFFYQNIYANDEVRYFPVDRKNVHKDMSIWENPKRNEIYLTHSESYGSCFIVPPGTYENSDCIVSGKYTYESETFIDSYEIIDKERYDQLIEVL